MQVTKVALIGMGTVGTGVARLLIDHGDRTARHAGRTLLIPIPTGKVRSLNLATAVGIVLYEALRQVHGW